MAVRFYYSCAMYILCSFFFFFIRHSIYLHLAKQEPFTVPCTVYSFSNKELTTAATYFRLVLRRCFVT